MMKRLRVLLVLVLILALVPAATAQANSPLEATTDHDFVGQIVDGYMQAWVGNFYVDDDDIPDGTIEWWIELDTWTGFPPSPVFHPGQAAQYSMIVKVFDLAGAPLLVTEEHGTTTVRHGKDSIWRANGTVTEAYGDFANWLGRNVHESGEFTWAGPGVPEAGTSIFRIN